MGNKEKKLQKKSKRRWKRTLNASKELFREIGFELGFWWRFLEYLTPPEQASLQLMGRYSYNIGVARAMKPFPIKTLFFPYHSQIWQMGCFTNKVKVLEAGVDSDRWHSIQVGSGIFQVHQFQSNVRLLQYIGSSRFSVISKAPLNQARVQASFCNLADQFIFATGGKNNSGERLKSVMSYDIVKDIWEEMPQMNVARESHSSCILGTAVYVVCGYNFNDAELNSIEKLETRVLQAGWQLIQMPRTSLLTPREVPVVAELNQNEILIMGGYDGYYMSEALSFDTRTDSIKEVVRQAPFELCMLTAGCVHVWRGSIFAQVHKNGEVGIIEYKNGSIQSVYPE